MYVEECTPVPVFRCQVLWGKKWLQYMNFGSDSFKSEHCCANRSTRESNKNYSGPFCSVICLCQLGIHLPSSLLFISPQTLLHLFTFVYLCYTKYKPLLFHLPFTFVSEPRSKNPLKHAINHSLRNAADSTGGL